MIKRIVCSLLVAQIAIGIQGCSDTNGTSVSDNTEQSSSISFKNEENSWLKTHDASDFSLEELIGVNSLKNLTSTGKVVKIHFEGYDILKETQIENGQEITYETGVQSEPQFVSDTYTWKGDTGLNVLRTISKGEDGKEIYYLQNENNSSAILYGKELGGDSEIGVYVNDGYDAQCNTYIGSLLNNGIKLDKDIEYDEEQNLYKIGIRDTNDYYYDVYFDDNLIVKEVSQEFRYGQKTLMYKIQIEDTQPSLPDWVNDIQENSNIDCKIKIDNENIKFKAKEDVKLYIYTGDNYSIVADNPVNTMGVTQNNIVNNTDFYVQQDTVFTVKALEGPT